MTLVQYHLGTFATIHLKHKKLFVSRVQSVTLASVDAPLSVLFYHRKH